MTNIKKIWWWWLTGASESAIPENYLVTYENTAIVTKSGTYLTTY